MNLPYEMVHTPLAELSPNRTEASPALAESDENAIALPTAHLVGSYVDTITSEARLPKECCPLIDRWLALQI